MAENEIATVGFGKPPAEHRFKPGNPGGPGRPPKRPVSESYEHWLNEPLTPKQMAQFYSEGIKLPPNATNSTLIAMAIGRKAQRGDVTAAREVREATEGKAMQRIELARGEDRTPEFVVVYATAVPGIDYDADSKVIDVTPEPEEKKDEV